MQAEPCFADALEDKGVHAANHRVHGWTTLTDGASRVSYGFLLPSREHMVAAGAASKMSPTAWERDATLENEPVVELEHVTNFQSMMAALNGDRFILGYGVESGVRVLARDAKSGTLQWDVLLAKRPRNAALRSTPSRIYVHADRELFVIDASTGAVLGTM